VIGRRSSVIDRSEPPRKPSAVPCDPPVDPVGNTHPAGSKKRKRHRRGTRKSGQGLADSGGAREDLPALVDQVKLFKTPLLREAPKTSFQVGFLKWNQLEPLCLIPPVDPPGEASSEASVAVVYDHGFRVGQRRLPSHRYGAHDAIPRM